MYLSVQSLFLALLLIKLNAHNADADRVNFEPITIGHTPHSRPTAAAYVHVQTKSLHAMVIDILAVHEHQYSQTIETGMTENN